MPKKSAAKPRKKKTPAGKATKPSAPLTFRDARRQRQQLENPERAKVMRALRRSMERDGRSPRPDMLPAARKYFIGCSGWFYWGWKDGVFYPAALKTSQWFKYYTERFDTVELNAPFYSWPTEANIKSWLRPVRDKLFVYTVKVNEQITHTRKFKGAKTFVKDFGVIADLLGPHMGCFLFQIPPSFHYSPGRLKTLLESLDHSRRNVIEFRHASWWNDTVFKAFRRTGTIFCACSAPRLPDTLVKTADDIYIRFHGPEKWYRHDYSDAELADWARRIQASGARRVWAYFNNDIGGNAPRNAARLAALLDA